jgi:hypothetical protein
MDNYHLTKDGDEWKLRRQGAERSALISGNKKAAVEESAEFMRQHGGSLKIHKENGGIQEERTYPRSADPRKSPG